MATGGFKLSLAGAKGKPGLKALTEQPAKRRRLALDDDEPEEANAKQEITGWDAAEGGAVDANKKEEPKGPRVIPKLPNRDWRETAQKRQLARTGAPPPTESTNGDNVAQLEQPKMAFGLTTFDKKDEDGPEPMDVDGDVKPEDNRTAEEKLQAEAFEALVNGKPTNQAVIPISEEEAYENDMREAPDAPDLAAYEATPIEGFGAALLRGMGWKDGESLGKDKKPLEKPKRRPALLGIGANPEAAEGVELGEWSGPKKRGSKKAINYNPVTLRNKHTGEMITEEELKEKRAKEKEADEQAARNNTFVGDDDDEEDERRREKRREKSRRDERRRDRDDEYSDRDRDRRREKKYSEYEDSDRDRRRDKKYRDDDYDDRRREKRRDRDSRRDRSRSPYDDDRREKRRERDRRERSVDSKDRREKRRDRNRSRDSDDRRKRRDYEYDDKREERRNKYKDDKYSRR